MVYYLMKKANLFSILALRLVKVMYVFCIEILELDMQENISHWKEKRCLMRYCVERSKCIFMVMTAIKKLYSR